MAKPLIGTVYTNGNVAKHFRLQSLWSCGFKPH